MPQDAVPNLQADADQLEAATDEAIAACGGNAREAVKALIVANEFLESEVCELMQTVSHAYAREDSRLIRVEAMENEKNHGRSNVHFNRRPKRLVSRTRLVMGLLLIVAIPIFISLASKAVRENAAVFQQVFGR
jgi:hypothetical protein